MPLHVANFYECDRISAVAAAGLTVGMVVTVTDDGAGQRLLTQMANGAAIVKGCYAIVAKELVDPYEVVASTATADTGFRTVSINAGDNVLELRRGVKAEYSPDMFDASLDPARSGTLPTVGQQLGVKNGLWCTTTVATASGNANTTTTPICEVTRVFGSGSTAKVVLELL